MCFLMALYSFISSPCTVFQILGCSQNIQFSSVAQSCLTLRTHGLQHTRFPLSITNLSTTSSRSLLRLMSIESVMPSNNLIVCRPLLLPSIYPSFTVFSSEPVVCIRWPKCCISPSNEYSGVISIRTDWFDFLSVQETLKSLL